MKVGVIYPQPELRGDPLAVRRFGLAAEELGFEHLLAFDHILGATHDRTPKLTGPYNEHDAFHDPLVMFSFLAGLTSRIAFVTGILILPQRQTVLVARQTADLDLLSGERLRLGVGLGWNYVEYDAMGQDFRTRGRRIREQVDLLRRLWSEPLVEFQGQFDKVDRVALNPRPRRAIPVWLGGFADVVLQRAAAIADGFIFADWPGDSYAQLTKLRVYLGEAGRDTDGFGFSCNILRPKTPEEAAGAVARWRDAGGTHASVSTMRQNFCSVEQHVDYMKRLADALQTTGR